MAEGEGVKLKLFQFWNTERAPNEVEVLMQTWADDPTFEYHRFTAETAADFIKAHFDARTLAAYRKCGVPAMQADFFRYCALYVHGGVYVDADTKNSRRLPELLDGRKRGLLMTRETRVANDFLYVCAAQTELYKKVIERAVENIEGEISNNVWLVTGPGIMTKFFHQAEEKNLFDLYDIEPERVVREFVLFQNYLEYKNGDDDWRKSLEPDGKRIFI